MTGGIKRLVFALSLAWVGTSPVAAYAEQEHLELTKESTETLSQFFKHEEWQGVKNLFGAAKAIIVVPDFTSGSFIVGFEKGSGVIMTRHGGKWSDPAFVALSQRSIGFQAGAKESEFLMMIFTRTAVDALVSGSSRVGGTGGFALGNLGTGASAGGGISGGIQILTVSTSEGLALGSGLTEMTISTRDDLNIAAHGKNVTLESILAGPGGKMPASEELRKILAEAVQSSWND